MAPKKETRYDDVPLSELQEAHRALSEAVEGLGKLIRQMEKDEASQIRLRWRTLQKTAAAWESFVLGLPRAYKDSKEHYAGTKSGGRDAENAKKSRGH